MTVANMSIKHALRGNPGLAALNRHVVACAGDDAPAVMAARAEHEERVAQARAAQASGADFEGDLEAQHDAGRAQGIGDIEKLSIPVAIEQDLGDGRFIGRRRGRVGADYRGLLRGGVPIAIEAKNAGRHRLALVDDGSPRFAGVKRHQANALARCLKLGGVALLLVRFKRRAGGRDVETDYAVPWDEVCHLDSLGPDDVHAWRVLPQKLYFERWAVR